MLLARGSDLGYCRKAAKACLALRLYYPFMVFHINPSHTAGGNVEHMKHNYIGLGVVVKGMGA